MGKITRKDATDLIDKGIITKEDLQEMENQNLVSKRGKSAERYMKSKDGKWVIPTLYFKGLTKGGEYTKKMTDLKAKITTLIESNTVIKDKTNNKGVSN